MIGKNWAMTHPFGKNKIWRTLKWGFQRFWRGWDETMPDNATSWTFEFIQKACEDRIKTQWTVPWHPDFERSYTSEEWEAELRHGKELARKAQIAYWNDWEKLGIDYDKIDLLERHQLQKKFYKDAIDWWSKQLIEDNFND